MSPIGQKVKDQIIFCFELILALAGNVENKRDSWKGTRLHPFKCGLPLGCSQI